MAIVSELKRALRSLSAVELESIADWLEVQVEESRFRTYHVREAQPDWTSAEPFSMTWEEYLALEEQSPHRHENILTAMYTLWPAKAWHTIALHRHSPRISNHTCGAAPGSHIFFQVKLEIRVGGDEIMYYPDVMVSCRPQDREDQIVRNPKLVVEILSKSTRDIDQPWSSFVPSDSPFRLSKSIGREWAMKSI